MKTAEFRWFWTSDDEQRETAWFAALDGQRPIDEPPRQDRYLLLPGCRTTGVKLREGRFEIKALLAEQGDCSMPGWPAGPLQTWIKWSVDSSVLADHESELATGGGWRQVGKTRLLRRYSQREDGQLQPVAEAEAEQSCRVELTRVSLPGQPSEWLTLGFETSFDDEPDRALARIQAVIRHVCDDRWKDLGRRANAAAAGYPGWLATLES